VSGLLTVKRTNDPPEVLVRRSGKVISQFDHRTQDSGNISWVVQTGQGSFFVKTAGTPGPVPAGAAVPYLDHAGRVRLLRNAAELARSCRHACLARLRNVIESPLGPALVYDHAPGDLVGTDPDRRMDPQSAYQRFAHVPADQLLHHFDSIIDLHQRLAALGWVASDLYDGCLLVDFATGQLTLIDLDCYQRGAGVNSMGRMFGSSRFMAPEEFQLGAPIDQRTTVYNLGRLVWHFGTRLTERADQFCGSAAVGAVVEGATNAERGNRFATVEHFASAWREVGPPADSARAPAIASGNDVPVG
jgi:serine/threonine-protein kinase